MLFSLLCPYPPAIHCNSCTQAHRRLRPSGSGGSSGFWFSSHSHAKFVNQLMRESRLRVSMNRFLWHVVKGRHSHPCLLTPLQVKHMLGSTGESVNTIEENTHIAYLCDLLERIWGHGLKKREVKWMCVQSVYSWFVPEYLTLAETTPLNVHVLTCHMHTE